LIILPVSCATVAASEHTLALKHTKNTELAKMTLMSHKNP